MLQAARGTEQTSISTNTNLPSSHFPPIQHDFRSPALTQHLRLHACSEALPKSILQTHTASQWMQAGKPIPLITPPVVLTRMMTQSACPKAQGLHLARTCRLGLQWKSSSSSPALSTQHTWHRAVRHVWLRYPVTSCRNTKMHSLMQFPSKQDALPAHKRVPLHPKLCTYHAGCVCVVLQCPVARPWAPQQPAAVCSAKSKCVRMALKAVPDGWQRHGWKQRGTSATKSNPKPTEPQWMDSRRCQGTEAGTGSGAGAAPGKPSRSAFHACFPPCPFLLAWVLGNGWKMCFDPFLFAV